MKATNSAKTRIKTLHIMYKNMLRTRDEYVDAIIANPSNMNEFIFRVRNMSGDNDEFKDGEYLFRLIVPPTFPYKPPDLVFLTPNGIYELNGSICISTGKFHSQNYVATRGLVGFGTDVWTAMIQYPDLGGGIRIISTSKRTPKNIRKLAEQSKEYNRTHYAEYIEKLEKLPCNVMYRNIESYDIPVPAIKKKIYTLLGLN